MALRRPEPRRAFQNYGYGVGCRRQSEVTKKFSRLELGLSLGLAIGLSSRRTSGVGTRP